MASGGMRGRRSTPPLRSGAHERPVVLVAARPVVRRLVRAALDPEGLRVTASVEGETIADSIAEVRPDVVVLEADGRTRMSTAVPGRGGPRRGPVPLLVLGGHAGATSAATALDAGADDYVAPPFDPQELAARVRSLVRRHAKRLASGRRRVGSAIVDLGLHTVTIDGRAVGLARSEWRLLVCLLAEPEVVVPYEVLAEAAFGWEARGDVTALRDAVRRLRRKLGRRPGDPGPIHAVRGFGYRLAFSPEIPVPPGQEAGRPPAKVQAPRSEEPGQ